MKLAAALVLVTACAVDPVTGPATLTGTGSDVARSSMITPYAYGWILSFIRDAPGMSCAQVSDNESRDVVPGPVRVLLIVDRVSSGAVPVVSAGAVATKPAAIVKMYTNGGVLGGYDETAVLPTGTLTVTSFDDDVLVGELDATGSSATTQDLRISGTFQAPRCD